MKMIITVEVNFIQLICIYTVEFFQPSSSVELFNEFTGHFNDKRHARSSQGSTTKNLLQLNVYQLFQAKRRKKKSTQMVQVKSRSSFNLLHKFNLGKV
jgi:hypothetical protein